MKHFIYTIISIHLICVSCKEGKKDETDALIEQADKFLDSIATAKKVDSMVKSTMRSAYFDTTGISTSPIKVLSTRIVKNEYSAYRDISLTWKNISNKKISAVRFKWYGVNAFNEPADMGSGFDGLGGGMSDDALQPGKTDNSEWSILSSNVKKILCAWPYEVAFADGTFWKQKP